jgi:general secretion pathway protein A
MYERFFGLVDAPFRLTPDPRYLFLSRKHADALAHLRLGLTESSGFVCITGDVGTGKTTLLRSFLTGLGPEVATAYVISPTLSVLELLRTINGEFGLPASSRSRKKLVDTLNTHLLAQCAAGRRAVVIVDEAQALSMDVLEELRLLSNLETTTEKLLRVVLVGQPQLRELLLHPSLVQLNQRITLRWHVGPLRRAETLAYVRHRLRIASEGQAGQLFTTPALRLIHRLSGGVPRLVNMVAHRSLVVAFAAERRRVRVASVLRAYRELDAVPLPTTRSTARRAALGLVALGACVGVLALGTGRLAWTPGEISFSGPSQASLGDPGLGPQAPDASADAAPATEPGPVANGEPAADTATVVDGRPAPEANPVADAMPGPDVNPVADAKPAAEGGGPIETATAEPPAPTAVAAEGADVGPAPAPGPPPDAAPPAIAEPPPAMAASPPPDVAARLARLEPAASLRAAIGAVLARWQVKALAPAEPVTDLRSIAARRGLEYTTLAGSASMLRLLDLPAILELRLGNTPEVRWVALTGLRDDGWALALDDTAATVDPRQIERHWYGRAHVFWRDFEGLGNTVLDQAARGPEIARLQTLLHRAGLFAGPATGQYGSTTSAAVLELQRRNLLTQDGRVGPLTRIVLYTAAGGYPGPHLAGQAGEAS